MKTPQIIKMRFPILLSCLLFGVNSTDGSSDQRKHLNQRSNVDTFRPRPHVTLEKYHGVSSQSDNESTDTQQVPSNLQDLDRSRNAEKPTEPNLQVSESSSSKRTRQRLRSWESFNEFDKHIIKSTLPLSAVFAIMPLSVSMNLFWVNQLGDALAVAGQSAANQIYQSSFWLFSFLPSVTATLVSKSHANGDIEGTQDAVCQALFFSALIALGATLLMFFNPAKVLSSVLKDGTPALQVAVPYLRIRAFSFLPMLVAFVGFSTFRGTMDVTTSVKIALFANIVTWVLDPILIHVMGLGVRGSAFAALAGDLVNAAINLKLLTDKNLIHVKKLLRLPSWARVAPLLKGGIALQIRSLALNLTQLMSTRTIQSIDGTGVAPAAHALAMQTFMMGGIFLGALGMSTQTMIPNAMAKEKYPEHATFEQSTTYVDLLVRRLFRWGIGLGVTVGLIQMALIPIILNSSPLVEVRQAARIPALLSMSFQWITGFVNVGEGVMMGMGDFTHLAVNIVVGAFAYIGALRLFSPTFGLTGVWMGNAVFAMVRAAGVVFHSLSKKRLEPLSGDLQESEAE